jgi:hypothetical protein
MQTWWNGVECICKINISWRRYISTDITFLDIIHFHCLLSKNTVLSTLQETFRRLKIMSSSIDWAQLSRFNWRRRQNPVSEVLCFEKQRGLCFGVKAGRWIMSRNIKSHNMDQMRIQWTQTYLNPFRKRASSYRTNQSALMRSAVFSAIM